jgi:hypothetical protein
MLKSRMKDVSSFFRFVIRFIRFDFVTDDSVRDRESRSACGEVREFVRGVGRGRMSDDGRSSLVFVGFRVEEVRF